MNLRGSPDGDAFLTHIEAMAGPMLKAGSVEFEGHQILILLCKPVDPTRPLTWCTMGLSNLPWNVLPEDPRTSYELSLSFIPEHIDSSAELLFECALSHMLWSRRPLYRGEHVDASKLRSIANIQGLYVSLPVFFEEEHWAYRKSDGREILYCATIPLTSSEVRYLHSHGFEALEAYWEENPVDLANVFRDDIEVLR